MLLIGQTFSENNKPNSSHKFPAVYMVTNTVNGKIYVGSTKSFQRRFAGHRFIKNNPQKASTFFEHTIIKYGFDVFVFEILETPNEKERFEREQYWIDKLQPFESKGYNLAKKVRYIPNRTMEFSEKSKLEMSERSRKTALKYAEQTRQRSSKPVYQIDPKNGKVINEYPSASSADKAIGCASYSVNKACRKLLLVRGFFWSYKKDYDNGNFKLRPKRKVNLCASFYNDIKPIIMMDKNGNELAYWDCAKDIHEIMGFTQSPIYRCCRGERDHSNGFKWKFIEDKVIIATIKKKRKLIYEKNKFKILE